MRTAFNFLALFKKWKIVNQKLSTVSNIKIHKDIATMSQLFLAADMIFEIALNILITIENIVKIIAHAETEKLVSVAVLISKMSSGVWMKFSNAIRIFFDLLWTPDRFAIS